VILSTEISKKEFKNSINKTDFAFPACKKLNGYTFYQIFQKYQKLYTSSSQKADIMIGICV
jgi:hypothetical protein